MILESKIELSKSTEKINFSEVQSSTSTAVSQKRVSLWKCSNTYILQSISQLHMIKIVIYGKYNLVSIFDSSQSVKYWREQDFSHFDWLGDKIGKWMKSPQNEIYLTSYIQVPIFSWSRSCSISNQAKIEFLLRCCFFFFNFSILDSIFVCPFLYTQENSIISALE